MIHTSSLVEAISLGPQDYNSVVTDPQFRVGVEVEFVAVLQKLAEYLPKKSLTLDYVLRNSRKFLELFDVDFDSVVPVMQAWIHQTALANQSLLHTKNELTSIAAAEKLYGRSAIKNGLLTAQLPQQLGSSNKKLIDFWQKMDWTSQAGRIAIQTAILNSTWTPQMWLRDLDTLEGVRLRDIWKQITAQPKYGWANSQHSAVYSDPQQQLTRSRRETLLVKQLNSLDLSTRVGYAKSLRNYEISYDGSIQSDHRGSGQGFELVGPPLEVGAALDDLKKIFEWISSSGHYTNSSTGFHVGVSYGSSQQIQQVNKIKLLMLLGEHHLLQLFDRELNTYTQSHILKLKKSISNSILKGQDWTRKRTFAELLKKIERKIDLGKYTTVNFKKLAQGYLEFRIMGNENYHERFNTVRDTILKYAFVLRAALDPHEFEETYKKQLAKLFSEALSASNPTYPDLVSKYAVSAASKPGSTVKNLDLFLRAQTAFAQGNQLVGTKIMSILIDQAAKLASSQNSQTVRAAALSYRIFLQRHNISLAQFGKLMAAHKVKPDVARHVRNYLRRYAT